MTAGQPHVFRFFASVVGVPGMSVELDATDAQHAQVLRMRVGTAIELVDATQTTWQATVRDASSVVLTMPLAAAAPDAASIEVIAGALVGGRFDELVDGAVQAGATRIVPYVATRRDAERLTSRRARLERIARASAKQAKRDVVPEVGEPIDDTALLALEPGIVLDGAASAGLDAVIDTIEGDVRLLIGAADGVPAALVDQLVERGWQTARLGPSVLRAELAAAVAVAIASLRISSRA
ncbi:MAG: rRNA methyltransferase [Thermoleophilia bacterium]|nr:rRNA methyltransferase [Thermoleophilia bacterium]MCZ4495909.1 rRNA methyltransferase [Thermoleophilia bacterium]